MSPLPVVLALIALALLCALPAAAETAPSEALAAVPAGYHLVAYDECGDPDLQPNIVGNDIHTYTPGEVNAPERARTVSWGWKQVVARYSGLDPQKPLVVAVTYANEPFNARVQSLWAGAARLHGPHALPRGGVERLAFAVPSTAYADGRLELQFRLEGPVNVVVSEIELWSPTAPPPFLRISHVEALYSDVAGRVLDLHADPVPGARVALATPEGAVFATAESDSQGGFSFARATVDQSGPAGVVIRATAGQRTASTALPRAQITFEPVRYRPIPTMIEGVSANQRSLDGEWRINTGDPVRARGDRLTVAAWRRIRVPGQWLQQGFDLPKDQPVSMAREFVVPRAWAGSRVILRFDSIHAGTRYFVNGHPVGASERLFTPVEWDITDLAPAGKRARLDLEMLVDTPSERLSYASGYAFHNLGGIDRSVRIYALPATHLSTLRIHTDLDAAYRDASLTIAANVTDGASGVALHARLIAPAGATVAEAQSAVETCAVALTVHVPDPPKWTAETPILHRLVLELRRGPTVLERVERNIGFRKIEVRGSKLLVNGRPIKLTGACRHEIDPLTGRAGTARLAERDVRLMKGANLNLIRTSHYPPCQELVDAADRLGIYLEVEAPFCWVGAEDPSLRRSILEPTSAMVDYYHTHPSVLYWSLANESEFIRSFEVSHRLVRDLDPTRPTTFNNPDPKRICEIANVHYPGMPYDGVYADDPRPLFLGEFAFPVCHEQTDVRVNPGLRELWGHGQADAGSAYARECARAFETNMMRPGLPPGAWTHIVRSERVLGGAIWAAFDEPFYLPGNRQAGYAWVHGFWGIADAWRRPKPEWLQAKLTYSPVWFPDRHPVIDTSVGVLRIPVENRYAFTDLAEVRFVWRWAGCGGQAHASVAPGSAGQLEIPVPSRARPGDPITVEVAAADGSNITFFAASIGDAPGAKLGEPEAGAPKSSAIPGGFHLAGAGWELEIDGATGEVSSPRAPLRGLPSLHVTRYDFGDLAGPGSPPYAVLPAREGSRRTVGVEPAGNATRIVLDEQAGAFSGRTTWTIDRTGVGRVGYDYTYAGPEMNAREVGVALDLAPGAETLRWRRWSEWGPGKWDDISRPSGTARARRRAGLPATPDRVRPTWAWALDETDLGTADFRSVKYNVYEASVTNSDGAGVRLRSNAEAHIRANLLPDGVRVHALSTCGLGPVVLRPGDHLTGSFALDLIGPGRGGSR